MNPDAGYTSSPIHPAHGLYALYYPEIELSEEIITIRDGLYNGKTIIIVIFKNPFLLLRYSHKACKYVPAQVDIIRSASQFFRTPIIFFHCAVHPCLQVNSSGHKSDIFFQYLSNQKLRHMVILIIFLILTALLLHSLTSHMESGNGLRRNYVIYMEGIPGVQSISTIVITYKIFWQEISCLDTFKKRPSVSMWIGT